MTLHRVVADEIPGSPCRSPKSIQTPIMDAGTVYGTDEDYLQVRCTHAHRVQIAASCATAYHGMEVASVMTFSAAWLSCLLAPLPGAAQCGTAFVLPSRHVLPSTTWQRCAEYVARAWHMLPAHVRWQSAAGGLIA